MAMTGQRTARAATDAEEIRAEIEDILYDALARDARSVCTGVAVRPNSDGHYRCLEARIDSWNKRYGSSEVRTFRVSAPMDDGLRVMLDAETLLAVRRLTADWTGC